MGAHSWSSPRKFLLKKKSLTSPKMWKKQFEISMKYYYRLGSKEAGILDLIFRELNDR